MPEVNVNGVCSRRAGGLAGIVLAPSGQKIFLILDLIRYGIAEFGKTIPSNAVRVNGSVRGVCEESQLEFLSGPEDGRAEVVCAVIPDSLLVADINRSVTAVGPLATIGVCSHSEASAGISEIIVVNHSAPGFGKGRGGLVRCMVEGMKIKLLPSLCITELTQAVFGGGRLRSSQKRGLRKASCPSSLWD